MALCKSEVLTLSSDKFAKKSPDSTFHFQYVGGEAKANLKSNFKVATFHFLVWGGGGGRKLATFVMLG